MPEIIKIAPNADILLQWLRKDWNGFNRCHRIQDQMTFKQFIGQYVGEEIYGYTIEAVGYGTTGYKYIKL